MKKIKLCVLDEPLEREKLLRLLPITPKIIVAETKEASLLEPDLSKSNTFSHGTLCMAILVEALLKFEIVQDVEIHHFSIGYLANHHSENALLEGLKYCLDQSIDLVSCSVGIFQRLWATPIISFLHERKKPLIIAAAANNKHITYPASLPSVLGVNNSESAIIPARSIAVPSDGIDLLARCFESEIIDKVGYDCSNSILAPQLCAQAAKLVLQGFPPEKEILLATLTKGNWIESSEKLAILNYSDPDSEPPVVLLPYSGEGHGERFYLAERLQREFEEHEYSCAILSDRLLSPDFEAGHFPVDLQNLERDISYYIRAAEHSLFLLVTEKNVSCDLQLNEREMSADQISELFEKILTAFPDS